MNYKNAARKGLHNNIMQGIIALKISNRVTIKSPC